MGLMETREVEILKPLDKAQTENAWEELKMLQSIIARHDDISFRVKGWCITLNVGVLAAIYGVGGDSDFKVGGDDEFKFSDLATFISLYLVLLFFLWIDAIYRVAMNRAIERASEVEQEIRNNTPKGYPKIGLTLGQKNLIKDQLKTLKNIRVIAPYVIIFVIDT